ncbi:MAG: D-alanyl-D-alanine carboxypeptidase [Bacteroidota bacterium]
MINKNTTSKKIPTSVKEWMDGSDIFNKSFTGFALYDPKKKNYIYQRDADKYFTPASNTKIFTLYTCLETLGDSIPALKYVTKNDSLIFWGIGDPSFMHPELPESDRIISFLKNRKEKLFFSPTNFQDKRYGVGWAWDDYGYYYQAEKSPFPIHANTVKFSSQPEDQGIEIFPTPFKSLVYFNPAIGGSTASFQRREFANIFEYNQAPPSRDGFVREIPFHYSHEFFVELLSLVLEKDIELLEENLSKYNEVQTLYSWPVDDILTPMMQESDNFMAEQLLLMCSNEVFDTMNTRKIIRHTLQNHLDQLPDRPIWRDGSGLSRYNLFTPRTLVELLAKIYRKIPEERLFSIFPTGKKEGTIKNWYGSYVHAKTGTLSNRHCLSGYIETQKGKTLIFSFMHNNYVTSSTPLKEEMQKVLNFIHLKM